MSKTHDPSEETAIFNRREVLAGSEKKHVVPAIIIIEGPETGKIYPLVNSATFIGRDESSEITISDPAVSRKHMLVEVDENHICCIDLHSTNGTFVNSKKINKINLKEGDKVKVGNTLLKFSYQDSVDKKYQDKLYKMITFDELTSLYNQHNMFVFLDLCFKKAKQGEAFSVLFIDIDHFKRVNDMFGHLSGSKVLSDLGQIFLSNIRSTDFACRYGGEEFVIILPKTKLKQSLPVAEKLRKIVESCNFFSIHKKLIKITISVGAASYNPSVTSPQKIIELADMAMYRAKAKGRNRVEQPTDYE